MDYTETELLTKAKQFNQDALALIYDRYSPVLYQYAYRQMGDQQLAEDCVAETFTRLLQALKKKRGPKKHLRAYLYRIAHNWITDQFRRKPPIIDGLDENLERLESEETGAEAAVINKITSENLRTMLQSLPATQRQVIVLKHLEELSNAEVAEIIGKNNQEIDQ